MPVTHLALDGVSVHYPGVRVLTDVTLTVPKGEVVALIGENGSGKTTLLRTAAGEISPDRGKVTRPHRTGLLYQDMNAAGVGTVGEALEAAVSPVRALARAVEERSDDVAAAPTDTEAAAGLAEAIALAEIEQAWAVDAAVATVIAGVGLAHIPRERLVAGLSGGERRRLALATLLLTTPTLLLLDEPTNHLDDDGIDFLARRLRERRGPTLLASHDRAFLDAATTRVIDLDPAPSPASDPQHGVVYTGSYTDYLRARAALRRRWAETYAAEEAEIERLRRVVENGAAGVFHKETAKTEQRGAQKYYGDRTAGVVGQRVRAARRKLDLLTSDRLAPPPTPLRFTGFRRIEQAADPREEAHETGRGHADPGGPRLSTPPTPPRSPGHAGAGESPPGVIPEPVLRLTGAAVDGRLAPTSLKVAADERLLVLGPNGSGKSTLFGVIAGEVPCSTGERCVLPGLRIGHLTQDVAWSADDESYAPADLFDMRELTVPSGLVAERDLTRPLRELSLGTQRRVALALLVADPPDLLLLDEPTNHLALSLAEELEAAIADYPGAVMVASHDRRLRDWWRGRTLRLVH